MQVDKGRLLHTVLLRLKQLEKGKSVLLQPYKKDRSICVIRQNEGFQVLECGFARREFVVAAGKVKKLLKVLIRKEFPRSNKIWLTILETEQSVLFVKKFFSA